MKRAAGVLQSKLVVPVLPAPLVRRGRLDRFLDGILEHRVTVVSGSAGSGKTVAVAGWLAGRSDVSAAWVALDEDDDDAVRFWRAVAASLQRSSDRVGVGAAEHLDRGDSRPDVLAALLNDLAAVREPLVLVLDDFHVVTDPAITSRLSYFLEHLPTTVHAVIVSRFDPPVAMWALQRRGEMLDVREADLRFTADEVAEFLDAWGGLGLDDAAVEVLAERTEGWAAGLVLAVLSLRGRTDAGDRVRRFAGTASLVADYLVGEVLEQEPADVARFLLDTSVLDVLTPGAAAAVAGTDDAPSMLHRLRSENLFVTPLDDGALRYHRLFAELLRAELHRRDPQREHELHRIAAGWYRNVGDIERAVSHLLAAGDDDAAQELMATHALPFFDSGRLATLRRWSAALPSRPEGLPLQRLLDLATVSLLARDLDVAAAWLHVAEGAVAAQEGSATRERDEAAVAARWAVWHASIPDAHGTLRWAERAEPHAEAGASEDAMVNRLPVVVIRARTWNEDFRGARRAYADARPGPGAPAWVVNNLYPGIVSLTALAEGRVEEAHALARRALAEARRVGLSEHPAVVDARVAEGGVLLERNRLDAAHEELSAAAAVADRIGWPAAALTAQLMLARVARARGDVERALELARDVARPDLGHPTIPRAHAEQARRVEAHCLLAVGEVEQAEELVSMLSTRTATRLLRLRVLLARGDLARASAELDAFLAEPLATRQAIQRALFHARLALAAGDPGVASEALRSALDLAAPERLIRLLLDEGPDVVGLLRRLPSGDPFVEAVLAEATGGEGAAVPAGEPLSDRERTVLSYLPTRLSNAEIAAQLYVSLNTLKTHLKAIYRKLGASSRAQAVARAAALGLLGEEQPEAPPAMG